MDQSSNCPACFNEHVHLESIIIFKILDEQATGECIAVTPAGDTRIMHIRVPKFFSRPRSAHEKHYKCESGCEIVVREMNYKGCILTETVKRVEQKI